MRWTAPQYTGPACVSQPLSSMFNEDKRLTVLLTVRTERIGMLSERWITN